MHGCCHISFPNSYCNGEQAWLVLLADGVCKFDQDNVGEIKSRQTKDFQDGPQIMALGNGPKQG